MLLGFTATAQTNFTVFTDRLENGWENWSWATVNLANTSPVYAGTASISVTCGGWEAIYLHHEAMDGSSFTNLTFWINGGASGGQALQVQATLSGVSQKAVALTAPAANTWSKVTVSVEALGVAAAPDFDGFWIQSRTANATPVFYLDNIALVAVPPAPPATNAMVITVDAAQDRHAISPMIYGVAFASSNELAALRAPVNRSGGNAETRYNWQLNAHNHAADWYFESLADSSSTPGAATDDHIRNSKTAGAEPMVTVSMIGWMPKLGPNRARLASYSIAKYGPQTGNDAQWFADAGNGVSVTNSTDITWNNPNDANFLTNSLFQQAWLTHLTNRWGTSANGGVRFYCMDNEHTLWHSTHRDVHPVGTTMREIRDLFLEYAGRVKAIDPQAVILGPEEWGWSGYFWSGFDQQWSSAHNDWNPAHFPDRGTNAGWDYIPWLLDQFRQQEQTSGQRLLDILTVHFYPQGGEFGNDTSSSMQLKRNKSTRALWDKSYTDPTWIGAVVKLIPRLKDWVATYYPGTRIGITEYNWGAENHINGATSQADILGIFAREGLDYATRWTTPAATTPTFKAMQLYRNYDGKGSTFGEVSVRCGVPNPDNLSTFGAVRNADGALTLMLVNKQLTTAATTDVVLTNFNASAVAQAWQLTSANNITRLTDLPLNGSRLSAVLPAQSVTLLVVPAAPAAVQPRLRAGPAQASGVIDLVLEGEVGRQYALYSSTDLVGWTAFQTNRLDSSSLKITLPAAQPRLFYKAAAQ